MADKYFEDATHKTEITGDEAIGATSDPGGTPADVYITPNDLYRYFAGTLYPVMTGLDMTWDSATSITIGVGACYAEDGSFIPVATAITKSGLSLTASTMYHVYLYLNTGTPAAEVVTTAPVAWKGSAYSKTGATSRRYVGSILTDGDGNVYEFRHKENVMFYVSNYGVAPFMVLDAGAAQPDLTNVSCSGALPVTTKLAKLRFTNVSATLPVIIGVGAVELLALSVLTGGYPQYDTEWALDESLQFSYQYSTTGGELYVVVLGYLFNR